MTTHTPFRLLSLLILPVLISCAGKQESSLVADFKQATVYTTADSTNFRLSLTDTLTFGEGIQAVEGEQHVFVNPQKSFQEFVGIGGAITDASAEVISRMPADKQTEILNAYYSRENGIGYSLIRTTIHSSDFSSGSYTYVADGDKELTTFSIDHDRQFRIPVIKRALEITGGTAKLYASPWSPPAWMKDNGNMLRGGKLLPEFYDSWATYYVRFINEYEKEGIPVWGLTIQNEPMATQRWESCIYTAEEERDFLKNHLGPTLVKAGLGDKKIIVWDHNRDLITQRANVILGDPDAAKYVWGVGFHWYETWAGGEPMFDNVAAVKESFPGKELIFTEGCAESFRADHYQYWPNAERYGRSMIEDFNNGTVAWTDWNIVLDETGGPNHVQNFCFAPIHGDTKTGEVIYTPTYYYIGHFSKFIRPGAKRISTVTSRSHLLATTFRNTDGSMITVVMNRSNNPIDFKLHAGTQMSQTRIPAHAMQTYVY
ncbi:MAG: glycoside hydrolase family 30 protein [Bacteroidetes bacterium]|nr:glycoside hydrolase family 30 protein [Bacteroidota bacterium]